MEKRFTLGFGRTKGTEYSLISLRQGKGLEIFGWSKNEKKDWVELNFDTFAQLRDFIAILQRELDNYLTRDLNAEKEEIERVTYIQNNDYYNEEAHSALELLGGVTITGPTDNGWWTAKANGSVVGPKNLSTIIASGKCKNGAVNLLFANITAQDTVLQLPGREGLLRWSGTYWEPCSPPPSNPFYREQNSRLLSVFTEGVQPVGILDLSPTDE